MQEVIFQNNFIGAWFLSDVSVCDDLIKYFENGAEVIEGRAGKFGAINKSAKSCTECYIDPNNHILDRYHSLLQEVCEQYKKKYEFCDRGAAWSIKDAVKIQKYKPGEAYYAWHFEREYMQDMMGSRHLVFLTYLNDVTDDGETEFYYQGVKIRPQKGLTLIWPADWTHTHRGVASMSQTKYIITGWYNFIE